jgi:MFS family permease
MILAAQFIAGAVSNVPGGLLVDSIGRKGLLMAVSLFWVGFPYLLMGFTHAYWMLLVCAALVGIGNNLWHPTAIPLLAQRFPERRGLAVSLHGMGANVGDAVAPLAAGLMLAAFSWRSVVVMNLVPGIAMACLILLLLGKLQSASTSPAGGEGRAETTGRQKLQDLKALFTDRMVAMLCLGAAFRTMTQSALLTFLPVFLAGPMGYSPAVVGGWMFALQAAGFAAAPVSGHLSDRMGRRRIIVGSMAMSAVVLLFMAFAGQSSAFVFFIALLGFFLFAVRAVLQAWLLDATPQGLGGTAIGLMFGTQAIGSAVGPLIAGVIADHYGLTATFYFLAATIVVANLFVFFTPEHVARMERGDIRH